MSNSLNALILAGGRSTRMGRDKGTLVYNEGKDQVRYLHDIAEPYVNEVYVSIRPEQSDEMHLKGYSHIKDARNISSPLNGILSAMDAYPETSWLVIAVDMPFVTPTAIETLLEKRDPTTLATCFESPVKGGPDPLFAIWEGHAKARIEEILPQDITCPRNMLKTLNAKVLQQEIDPSILQNINTPDEYKDAMQ